MKIYKSSADFELNDTKTDINNKNENIINEFYKKEINDLLLDFIKVEFDFLDIAVGIKLINKKYFDENSSQNIVKEKSYQKNIVYSKKETQEKLMLENDIDLNLNIEDESIFNNKIKTENKNNIEKINIDYDVKKEINSIEIINNMKQFIDDYNSLIDKVNIVLSENETDIKKEIQREEIHKLIDFKNNKIENERKIKCFISEIQTNIFQVVNEMSKMATEIGIKPSKEKKNLGIELDEEKYKKAIEENGRGVYKLLVGFEEDENTPIRNFKKTFEKYSQAFDDILTDSTRIINSKIKIIDPEEIKKQEDEIKRLIDKMYEKEEKLGQKFNSLKSSLEKCENQIATLA